MEFLTTRELHQIRIFVLCIIILVHFNEIPSTKRCSLKLIRLMYKNEKEKVVVESGIWSIQPIVNGVKVFDFPQELNKGDAQRWCLDYFDWRAAGWAWEVQQEGGGAREC